MSAYYTGRLLLISGVWHDMSALDDVPYRYPTFQRASEAVQRSTSLDGCIEGLVYDDQGTIIQQWVAGPYRSEARLVEPVCDPTAGEPGDGQRVG